MMRARLPRSISRQMVMVTIMVTMTLAVAFTLIALRHIRESQRQVADNQSALTRLIADNLDDKIDDALASLTTIAAAIPEGATHSDAAARTWLQGRTGLQRAFFSCGVFISGPLVAPTTVNGNPTVGQSPDFRKWAERTLALEEPFVSPPFIVADASGQRLMVATANTPIADAGGRVVATLSGCLDLQRPLLLGHLRQVSIGQTGYLFISGWNGKLLAHPDDSLLMRPDVHPIPAELLEQASHGRRSTMETVDHQGRRVLSTFTKLQSTGWVLGANLPVAEAYAGIEQFSRDAILGGVVGILVAAAVSWAMMRLFVTPIRRLADEIAIIDASGNAGLRPLAVQGGGHEIRQVGEAINHLVDRVNQEHDRRAQLLNEAEAAKVRLQAILDGAPIGLAIVGGDGVVQRANAVLAALFGQSEEAITGATMAQFFADRPSLDTLMATAWPTMLDGDVFQQDVSMRHSGGRDFWCRLTGRLVTSRDLGLGVVWIFEDISQRRATDVERQHLIDHLTEANTELERFAWVAAHDLREPLRTITSFTQLLQRQHSAPLDSEANHFADFVITAAARMHALIGGLLTYSRVTGKGRPFTAVDTQLVCSIALQSLRESIEEAAAEVNVGQLPKVMGDEVQLMQVFQNLIANAIKFHRAGSSPKVAVKADLHGDAWTFTVADNGIGIAADSQDVFEIFRRLHIRREYPGTGIGLTICKRIIQRHGGRIGHQPAEDGGTIFFFTLPLWRELDETTPQ
jgi:PAS domain S-box-containing protein